MKPLKETHKIHVKKGDNVVVISGTDKEKKGRVIFVFPSEGKVLVEGVNMIKRHSRPSKENQQGGIVNKEAPIDSSKVMLLDPKSGEPTKVGIKFLKNGEKVRYAKKSGEVIDK